MGTGIRKLLHHVWSGILIVTVDRPVGMQRGKLLVGNLEASGPSSIGRGPL